MNGKKNTWLIPKVSVVVFVYILIFFFYKGLISNTYEGDSLNYHIPIAKAFLNGSITNPEFIKAVPLLKYYPGSSEGILSMLILLGIPMSTYNVFAAAIFFLVLVFSGKRFKLGNQLSILFATSIVTLHTITRWINTQVIDIWLAVFFMLSLSLLQKPEKKISYFLILGFSLGMLIGTKYTGVVFFIVLLAFNYRRIIKVLNPKRIIAFLIPFTFFGLLWYLRNFLLTDNPVYPLSFLFFKGDYIGIENNVLRSLFYPNGVINFFNAIISEFGLWALTVFTPLLLFFAKIRKDKNLEKAKILILIGIINFAVFLFLPSDKYYNIVVSVFRYSYAAFIPIILSVFLIAQYFKKEMLISFLVLSGLIIVPELQYYPKLMFFFIPLALIIFYFEDVYSFIKSRVRLKGGK